VDYRRYGEVIKKVKEMECEERNENGGMVKVKR
jgi:hypothetical protein